MSSGLARRQSASTMAFPPKANLEAREPPRSRAFAGRAPRRNPRSARRLRVLPVTPAKQGHGRTIECSPPLGFIVEEVLRPFREVGVEPTSGTGVEPVTARLAVWCSTSELTVLMTPVRIHVRNRRCQTLSGDPSAAGRTTSTNFRSAASEKCSRSRKKGLSGDTWRFEGIRVEVARSSSESSVRTASACSTLTIARKSSAGTGRTRRRLAYRLPMLNLRARMPRKKHFIG